MKLYGYTIHPWESETLPHPDGDLDRLFRKHTLAFLIDKGTITEKMFGCLGTVNDRTFLGIDAGHLRGVFVNVDEVWQSLDSGTATEIIESTRGNRWWRLLYSFMEQSGWGWNQIPHPAGKGRAELKGVNGCAPFNMNAFFGADTFPVSQ